VYFLQLCFNPSDPAVEEGLYASATMRNFAGIDQILGALCGKQINKRSPLFPLEVATPSQAQHVSHACRDTGLFF
jgi:hypothetical protein